MNRTASVTALAVASLVPPAALPILAVAQAASSRPVATAASGRLVTGPTEHMKWGDVQVRLRLNSAGTRIVNVGATAPTERRRSQQINSRALPVLKREVLTAQSARINAVSGATMTSNAYESSLASAVRTAHL